MKQKPKNNSFLSGHHRSYIALTVAFVGGFALSAVILFVLSGVRSPAANAAFGAVSYGGPIMGYYEPVPPSPCPAHVVIYNTASKTRLGLTPLLSSTFRYKYAYLFTGSTPLFFIPDLPLGAKLLGLGAYAPQPCPGLPYLVLPFYTLTASNFVGSSLR